MNLATRLLQVAVPSALLLVVSAALSGCGESPPSVMVNDQPTTGASAGPGTLSPDADPRKKGKGNNKKAATQGLQPD